MLYVYRKTHLVHILIVGVSLLVAVTLSRSVYNLWKKHNVVGKRAEILAMEQRENERLQQELIDVQKPEFIEKEVREKLGMARDGEVVVILPKVQPPADKLGLRDGKKQTKETFYWLQWWEIFF